MKYAVAAGIVTCYDIRMHGRMKVTGNHACIMSGSEESHVRFSVPRHVMTVHESTLTELKAVHNIYLKND